MLLPSAARPSSLRCGGKKGDVVNMRIENSPRWPQGGGDGVLGGTGHTPPFSAEVQAGPANPGAFMTREERL